MILTAFGTILGLPFKLSAAVLLSEVRTIIRHKVIVKIDSPPIEMLGREEDITSARSLPCRPRRRMGQRSGSTTTTIEALIMATNTYRAVQVSQPGKFEFVERELKAPPADRVRIRVEACG